MGWPDLHSNLDALTSTHTFRRAIPLGDEIERSTHMTTHGHALLHLVISSPRDPESKTFEFPLTELVGDAAHQAAIAFGYKPGTPSFQTADHVTLSRTISLETAKLHDGEHLELVDVGGGV